MRSWLILSYQQQQQQLQNKQIVTLFSHMKVYVDFHRQTMFTFCLPACLIELNLMNLAFFCPANFCNQCTCSSGSGISLSAFNHFTFKFFASSYKGIDDQCNVSVNLFVKRIPLCFPFSFESPGALEYNLVFSYELVTSFAAVLKAT